MKTNETPEDDRGLRQVLREWRVETPLPPRFQEEVWRRIGRGESQAKASSLWAGLTALVGGLLARPRFALSYVTALLVVGVAAGAFAAQAATKRMNADLGARYVQSLDPYRGMASER